MADEPNIPSRVDRSGEIIGRYRAKLKTGSAERKTLAEANQKLEADLVKARAAADEAPLKVENDRLKGENRTIRHKAVFARVATANGVRPDAVEDLYRASEYKADKDDADEAALKELVTGLKATKGWAFSESNGAPSPTPTPTPTPPPIPGAGRGSRSTPSAMGITVTGAMRADHKFMLDPRNKAAIQDAAKNGRFVD